MNSFMGKEILSLVRGSDYAHTGEEEAIDIAFEDISKDPKRLLLDVGCGRGGTAQYVHHKGWGRVLGVDIDPDSIEYARKKYPDVEFIVGDAINLGMILSQQFDIIYLFNAFYAFSDHNNALAQLHKLSHRSGRLIIFDYTLRSQKHEDFPFKAWNPLDLSIIQSQFSEAGWRIIKVGEINGLYKKWYKNLLSRIEENSEKIIMLAGKEWLDFVGSFYKGVLDAIEKKLLGGAIVYADKSGNPNGR